MKYWVNFQSSVYLTGSLGALLFLLLLGGCQMDGMNGPGNVIEGTFLGANGQGVEIELKNWIPGKTEKKVNSMLLTPPILTRKDIFNLSPSGLCPWIFTKSW